MRSVPQRSAPSRLYDVIIFGGKHRMQGLNEFACNATATALVLGIFRSGETLRIFRMLPKMAEMVRELDPALR